MAKKKVPQKAASAKLTGPGNRRNGEQLVSITSQQVSAVQQCADYPNQPTVQAAATALQADVGSLDKTLTTIANMRAALSTLEITRDQQILAVWQHRRTLESIITVVCKGITDAIKAWGCIVQARIVPAASTDAPAKVTAKVGATPGSVVVRCGVVSNAASYLFLMSSDPTAPVGVGQPVILSKTRYDLSGQQVGHVLYFRAACVRRNGGMSQWSDAVQVTVR